MNIYSIIKYTKDIGWMERMSNILYSIDNNILYSII